MAFAGFLAMMVSRDATDDGSCSNNIVFMYEMVFLMKIWTFIDKFAYGNINDNVFMESLYKYFEVDH